MDDMCIYNIYIYICIYYLYTKDPRGTYYQGYLLLTEILVAVDDQKNSKGVYHKRGISKVIRILLNLQDSKRFQKIRNDSENDLDMIFQK